jgi:RHS repeat-associated protein
MNPLTLSDGTNSYIQGPGGLPIEQISNGGTVTYLHHDQAGSTRLLTGSTGTVTGKCTYGAYGTSTCEGTTTTPLGYDGQYTSSDTGLIYMRARVYDPATAQFLTVDPLGATTRAPYYYAGDNPLNQADPAGLVASASGPCGFGPGPGEEVLKGYPPNPRTEGNPTEEGNKKHCLLGQIVIAGKCTQSRPPITGPPPPSGPTPIPGVPPEVPVQEVPIIPIPGLPPWIPEPLPDF